LLTYKYIVWAKREGDVKYQSQWNTIYFQYYIKLYGVLVENNDIVNLLIITAMIINASKTFVVRLRQRFSTEGTRTPEGVREEKIVMAENMKFDVFKNSLLFMK